MTNPIKITGEQILSKQRELGSRERQIYEKERQRVAKDVIEKLAKEEFHGVLEKVRDYDLDIPRKYLEKLAELDSEEGTVRSLARARWAYEKLGSTKKAEEMGKRCNREFEREMRAEEAEVWLR